MGSQMHFGLRCNTLAEPLLLASMCFAVPHRRNDLSRESPMTRAKSRCLHQTLCQIPMDMLQRSLLARFIVSYVFFSVVQGIF